MRSSKGSNESLGSPATRFPNGVDALDLVLGGSTVPALEAMLAAGDETESAKRASAVESPIPLMNLAAANEHLGTLTYLKARGAVVDPTNGAGNTALEVALDTRHVENARWLLAHGADPSHRDQQGKTPAFYAYNAGDLGELEMVAKAGGGDLGIHLHRYGLMHLAAQRNDVAGLATMATLGLPIDDTEPPEGFTPLMAAALGQGSDVALWLLRHGANLKAKDAGGHGVLDYARASNTLGIDAFFRRDVLDKLAKPSGKTKGGSPKVA